MQSGGATFLTQAWTFEREKPERDVLSDNCCGHTCDLLQREAVGERWRRDKEWTYTSPSVSTAWTNAR